eukprot:39910-Chlamydomonas_euryale.AAC.1
MTWPTVVASSPAGSARCNSLDSLLCGGTTGGRVCRAGMGVQRVGGYVGQEGGRYTWWARVRQGGSTTSRGVCWAEAEVHRAGPRIIAWKLVGVARDNWVDISGCGQG